MKFCHSYSSFIFFGSGSVHRYKRCSIRKFIIDKDCSVWQPDKALLVNESILLQRQTLRYSP